MGQKANPIGLRLGVIRTWNRRWYASGRRFADLLYEDLMVKRYIATRLDNAGIASVVISRDPKKVTVDIHTSRPGIVIGRKGAEVDKLREELQLLTRRDIMLNIVEVRKPELSAKLVADSIARQLEGRVSFRRAMKKALAATMKMGAVGIKVHCAGRLAGAEIARAEKYHEGRVPLHTLRADIDYAVSTAQTTYGCIGVKVWICRGEVLEAGKYDREEEQKPEERAGMPEFRPKRPRRGGERPSKRPRGRIRRAGTPAGPPPKGRRPEGPLRSEGGRKQAETGKKAPETKKETKSESKTGKEPKGRSGDGGPDASGKNQTPKD
ncbi:MAG: 30S ribosomal protein S3 [Candidatus Zixiibacteriota bacterium]